MEWDGGQVYRSEQRLVAQAAESEWSMWRRRFVELVLHFRSGAASFVYRDQLVRNVNAGHRALYVELEDLQAFDEELSDALRDSPGEVLAQMEAAAAEVVIRLRIGDGTETVAAEPQPQSRVDAASIQVCILSQEHPHPIRELQAAQLDRLTRVAGIVTAASKVRAKARLVTLMCRHCGHRRVMQASAGFGGFAVPRACERASEAQCPLDPYMVLADESRFADWQTVKLQELPEAVPTGEVPRSLLLTLDRHLVDQVTPGERISAVGIFSTYAGYAARSGSGARAVVAGADALVAAVRAPYLRVVGVRPAEDRRDRHPTFTPEEEEEMARFSRLPHLYETLARSMAPELWGLDDPKRAILCQLFGGSRKHLPDGMRLRGDINVLLLGDPSTAKSQLLKFTERVAPVSVYTSGKGSSGAGLTASVIRDAASGEFHLEGGAMVLADGGVVCIDEFDKMRVADRVAIHEAMEQQTISIAKAGITTVLNSRAAVLAAANPLFGSFDDARGAAEQIDFASTILSRFDLIFVIKDVRDDERDRTIAQHVLALHQRVNRLRLQSSPGGSLDDASDAFTPTDAVLAGAASTGASMLNADGLVPLDKLRRYIAYVRRHCAPRLSPEAAELLRTAYVHIRQDVRSAADDAPVPVPITVRQLESMVRLTEALAKMRLSSTATAADAEEALRLFRVATIAASRSGAVPAGALEGGLSSEFLLEVQAAEASIRRRLTIGALLSEQRLLQDLARHHLSTAAIHKALQVMLGRHEVEWRRQRTALYRVR
ncbi:hypothetical protein CDCA_CDCA06G1994 [Cyanidium caldarium]|uniref:DNA replication licensing factor MCM5 n=1 Tax=Cyanidium caldarium TaxID=2771 RepID=A0AAV9IUZ8_CYACA|nr:hypothetical protein CDCA_CDCA06G1994 [Cyanidium caldarium]